MFSYILLTYVSFSLCLLTDPGATTLDSSGKMAYPTPLHSRDTFLSPGSYPLPLAWSNPGSAPGILLSQRNWRSIPVDHQGNCLPWHYFPQMLIYTKINIVIRVKLLALTDTFACVVPNLNATYGQLLFFSALIRTLFNRFPFFRYEPLLILLGALLGIGSRYSNEIKQYTAIIRDEPQNVFYIFLPVVAFEVSYFLDYQSVFKATAQIFILSAPLSGMYSFNLKDAVKKVVFQTYPTVYWIWCVDTSTEQHWNED